MSARLVWDSEKPAEADETPRPLRIVKREQQTVSDFSSTDSPRLPGVTAAQEDDVLSWEGSDFKRPSGTVAKPSSWSKLKQPRAASRAMLHVPRQRRRDRNPRAEHDSPLGSGAGSSLCHPSTREDVHGNTDTDRQSHNATPITGTLINSDLSVLPSRGHAVSSSSAPTPVKSNPRPRAFSSDSHLHPPRLQCQQRQPTLPSVPSRLLSRVMNRGAGKAHLNHAAFERGATPQQTQSNLGSDAENSSSWPVKSRSGTSSSVETAAAFDCDLDVALAAFPTPPKSTVTSPTTASSFETTRITPPTARTLTEPREVAISSAQFNLISEIDRVGADGGRSVLVAIEIIGGVAPIEDAPSQIPSFFTGLDVAIVIDNSLFASPGTLMANCEAARFLASLLDNTIDRLAVLCTRPIHSKVKDPNVVSPLSRTSIRKIKSTVDAIVNSTDKPEPAALGMALDRAIDLLTDPVSEQSDDEPSCDACGHVFMFTSNPAGVPSLLLNHPKIQVHIIRSGAVPWKGSDRTTCSGWKLAPIYSSSLQYTSLQKDKDKHSLFNRLRTLQVLARTGRTCGKVTDIVLEIEAGQGCSVEAVMGQREIAFLRPGEVITALVRVKVGAVFAKGFTLSPSPSLANSNSPTKPQDIFDELDVMLGASPTPLLIAKLTYKHSLLPAGTHCSTIAAAKLKRSLPNAEEETSVAKSVSSIVANPRPAVQKRLVYHLATHHSPRKAISILQEFFGVDGQKSFCPQYIKLVAEELRYQARIIERFDLPSPIKGGCAMLRNALPQEHFGHGLFNLSNYKPQDWLTGVSDEESTSNNSPESQSGSISQRFNYNRGTAEMSRSGRSRRAGASTPSARHAGIPFSAPRAAGLTSASKRNSGIPQSTLAKEPMDEMHRIWGDLKKMSKVKRRPTELSRSSSKGSQTDVPKGKWIQDLVIRNKQSIGTDTLVSLKDSGLGKRRENIAPWL